MRDKPIYLDHAATTPLHPEVLAAMLPYLTEKFGNASSLHRRGQEARRALDEARETVAGVLGCAGREVIFTSGGTESDGLAIRGVALAYRDRGNHMITSQVEHHAVLHTCEQLEKNWGFQVTYLPVNRHGRIDPEEVERAITPRTTLISIMYANNEVGVVQPIAEIGLVAHRHGICFHVDAVQAASMLELHVKALNADLLSLSAHKFYGPKGVGILFARDTVRATSIQTGGGQEQGRRAGTENVAGIVGAATALRLAQSAREANSRRLTELRDRLIRGVLNAVADARLTGDPVRRLPNNASFLFPGTTAEPLIVGLDMEGVSGSSGSACSSASLEPSHVLRAMGFPQDAAAGSLRLTLGSENTREEVEYVIDVLPGVVRRVREVAARYALAG